MQRQTKLYELSVIVPVYNEVDNLEILSGKTIDICNKLKLDFEIVFINDGSVDGSGERLDLLAKNDKRLKIIHLRRNFGQTAAISAGIDYCMGKIIILMDADLQNDPTDIEAMIAKINEGYEVVSGWRKIRKDPLITRKIPSYIANKIISWITGVYLHDYGCTLKAYKREVLTNIRLYGEMHRFIPAYASWIGARMCEMIVDHHPRIHGKSKYGLSRTFKTILDLLTVKFLIGYTTKPIYVFGGIGIGILFLGCLASLFVLIRAVFFHGEWISPMILIACVLIIASIQFVLMGLLGEMISRTYFESQNKLTYSIRNIVSFE